MKTKNKATKIVCAAILIAGTLASQAASVLWTGANSANWNDAGNWTPGLPGTGDALIFDTSGQTAPNNDLTGLLLGGITFTPTGAQYVLGGNAITLDTALVDNSNTVLQTIAMPLVLTNAVTFNTVSNLDTTVGNIEVLGAISGTGSLTKNGNGTLTLANGSYTGGTWVNGGLLVVSNATGAYTNNGGGLMLNFRTYYTGLNVPFTADSAVGVDLLDNTEPVGVDDAGTLGSASYTFTKIGQGLLRMVQSGNINSSSVDVAQGTLGSLGGGIGGSVSIEPLHKLGTAPITVEDGAMLRIDDGGVVPNAITLNGAGTAMGSALLNGALRSGSRNNGGSTTNFNYFTNTITLATASTIGAYYNTTFISGNIAGPGGLTKIGPNSLNVSGSNSFGGSLTINAGTFQIGSSNAIPPASSVTINGNSTLDLNGNTPSLGGGLYDDTSGNGTVENSSTNPVSVNLTSANLYCAFKNSGGGPLSLVNVSGSSTLNGAITASGAITVLANSLEMPMSTSGSNGLVSVADGAALTLDFKAPGASMRPNGVTLAGAGSGVSLNINLNFYGTSSKPVLNATNGSGVLTASGTTTITFNNPGNLNVGQYPIIKYKTRAGTGNFVLTSIPGIGATIITNAVNNSIDLKVTSAPIVTWKGKVNDNLWDTTTTNWTYNGSPVLYVDSIPIYFDDTALTNNVNLTTALSPGSVAVNTTNTYTFGGAGSLYGGVLTKNGTGTLVMDVSGNGYSSTLIGGGTLQVGANDAFGDLGSGAVDDEGSLVFNRSDNFNFANTISGLGGLVQNNTNITTLSAANGYSGGTLVSQGVLKPGNNLALGNPTGSTLATVASGASLDVNGRLFTNTQYAVISGTGAAVGPSALFISGGGTCIGCGQVGVRYLSLAGNASIGGSSGDFQIGADHNLNPGENQLVGSLAGNNFALTKVGSSQVYVEVTNASPLSQVTVAAGGLLICGTATTPFGPNCPIVISNNAFIDTWDQFAQKGITFPNPITITTGGGQLRNTHGSYGGNQNDNYNGPITLNDTLTTLCSYGKGQMFFNGTISGSGGILCSGGSRTVTLAGAMNYTGTTTVSNTGVLQLSANQQGGGSYTSADTATLDVLNQSVASTLPMSSLTLGTVNGGTLAFSRVTSFSTVNPIITATNLTLIGSSAVLFPPSVYATPGQYPLIKYTGSISGGGGLAAGGAGTRGTPGYISNNIANNTIYLVVPGGVPVIWTGASGGSTATNWDIASSLNWKTNGVATDYEDNGTAGDAVTFDESANVTNINITATVKPALVNVNNTNKLYTLTGSPIAGAGGLLKQGTGTLFLNNGANTFTGGSTINGGLVRLGNDGSLNNSSGTVTVSGNGTLDFNTFNPSTMACTISGSGFNGQGTLIGSVSDQARGPKTITLAGDATIGGSKRWDLRASGSALLSPTNSYTLTKVGANQISMVGVAVSTNLGDIRILGGTLSFETSTGYGDTNKTIYVGNGGGFGFYQNTVPLNKSLILSNGAAIAVLGGNAANQNIIVARMTLVSGAININGNFNNGIILSNIISGAGGLNVQFNSDVLMSATNTFTGDLNTGGRVKLVGNASLATTNIININNSGSGVLTLQDNTVIGGQQLQVFSGPATGALIVKNSGTINTKTIWVGNVLADWSGRTDGALTLQNGQTLRIDNGGRIKGNVVAASGSTVTPGGSFNIQNTGVCSNNVTCQAGSTTYMDISLNGGVTNNDALTVIGTLTYAGNLQINNMGTNKLTSGNSFKLFTAGAYGGAFASISTNVNGQFVTWNTSQLPVSGSLIVGSTTANNPTNIISVVNGSNVELSWPADHIGWSLQVQTNSLNTGLSTNWLAVPGSTLVNRVTNTINAANGCVFYRLSYP